MSRDEYPIMSYGQTGRYFSRNKRLSDEPYSQDSVIGRKRTHVSDDVLINPNDATINAVEWNAFIRDVLTDRESFIIERIYADGATQSEVAEELGISGRWVNNLHSEILDKLRKIVTK